MATIIDKTKVTTSRHYHIQPASSCTPVERKNKMRYAIKFTHNGMFHVLADRPVQFAINATLYNTEQCAKNVVLFKFSNVETQIVPVYG